MVPLQQYQGFIICRKLLSLRNQLDFLFFVAHLFWSDDDSYIDLNANKMEWIKEKLHMNLIQGGIGGVVDGDIN